MPRAKVAEKDDVAGGSSRGLKALGVAGSVGSGAVTGFLAWIGSSFGFEAGRGLAGLLGGIGFAGGALFVLLYDRYSSILRVGTAEERRDYAAIRRSLGQGGTPARIYAERLRAMLGMVDRFFGDAGVGADPNWTAPAYDRCLLLALIYPLAMILIMWVASGHVGIAEHALGLQPAVPGWGRIGVLALVCCVSISGGFFLRSSGKSRHVWGAAFVVTGVLAAVVAVAGAGAIAFVLAGAGVGGVAGAGPGAGAIAFVLAGGGVVVGVVAGAGVLAGAGAVAGFAAFGIEAAVAIAAVVAQDFFAQRGYQRAYLFALSILYALLSVTLPNWLATYPSWHDAGPLLLFLGLLTLINAPFDWLSLGLTRYLLRWGLNKGGWWPYVLALADAACAAVVITLLTVVSVLGIQTFDDVAVHGAGSEQARLLPLGPLFDGIQQNPTAPEYWWVYALLLSTMIPSLVNLVIGGASLLRGIPWLTAWLLAKMPRGKAPAGHDRRPITLALTGQWFVGAALGIVAQAGLAYAMIAWLLPTFGLDLLDLARLVEKPDLPGLVIQALFARR